MMNGWSLVIGVPARQAPKVTTSMGPELLTIATAPPGM